MGLLWGIFDKNREQKLKEAFDKIKKDIKALELKLNSFLFEKNYLSKQVKTLTSSFNSLLAHYKNAILQYNNLHSQHNMKFDEMHKELEQIKKLLKIMIEKLNETQKNQTLLDQKIEKAFSLYSSLNAKINGLFKKPKLTKIKTPNIDLSESEKKILAILRSLKNEYGSNIPVSVLLDEIYKGDRRKASTLSNYLNRLEQKGLIKRERKGRMSYVLIKS